MQTLDDLDRAILRILASDGQTNFKTIAERCKTTVGTVHNRIKRLRDVGIIRRMVPELDAKKLGFGITALVQFQIQGGHLMEVEQDLGKDPHVCSIYDVTGDYDAVVIAKFRDIDDLNTFVKRMLTNRFVLRTSTHLVLSVVKEGFTPRITGG